MADLLRDFWIREAGTGQQVAQLHDRYIMMIMMIMVMMMMMNKVDEKSLCLFITKKSPLLVCLLTNNCSA